MMMGLVSDTVQVAEVLASHFLSVSSDNNYSAEFLSVNRDTPRSDFTSTNSEYYNVPFQMRELNLSLEKTRNTSPGEDSINVSHLKQGSSTMLYTPSLKVF